MPRKSKFIDGRLIADLPALGCRRATYLPSLILTQIAATLTDRDGDLDFEAVGLVATEQPPLTTSAAYLPR